ncbi:ChaB family protein [Planktothrix sp. FACHB-1355]|uniref:ChaB family protein n=1 Tax=Aerosakkonema funiforme FACHB-1375 TaxID=2949571 RepID=A0A926VHY0_9CYAN|nr:MULTISPECIES: ChaB family protein [Oscillatoriales]MBD2184099.1 ChaB family protein [Aerosakkonema funiforme FACHB-1375]MBD3559367.1 ChaB family protein [Planktothrix sp. FACHB-1355]
MSQKQLQDLPSEVQQQLNQGAQQIFLAAYNSASEDGMSEEAAMNVAWNSVKQEYEPGEDGQWRPKPEDSHQHHKSVTSGGN